MKVHWLHIWKIINTKIKNNLFPLLIGIHVYFFIGVYTGVMPFFRGAYYYGLYYCTVGMMNTPTKGIGGLFETIRPQFFIPYGCHLMETYGLSFITYFFNLFGMSVIDSTKWGFFICYTISFITLLIFLYKITRNSYISLLYTLLFFIVPAFRYASRLVPPVYLGVISFPVSFLIDYYIYKSLKERKRISWPLFILIILIRIYVVSFSWYTAVIGACISCGFFLIFIIMLFLDRYKTFLFYLKNILVPWALALFLLLCITPTGASESKQTQEFFNGCSIDIFTLLFPTKEQAISSLGVYLPVENGINNAQSLGNIIKDGFYMVGNGNVWYLGYAAIITAIGALIWKKTRKKELIALAIVGLGFLIISLGPGLKFGEMLPYELYAQYGKYELPLEEDVFLFPWRFIFDIVPFSSMRAVSRWIYGMIPITLLLSAIFIKELCTGEKNKIWLAALIGIIAIIEYLPNGMKEVIYYDDMLNQLVADTSLEIEPIVNNEHNRLVICTYDYNTNAYATPIIMSQLDQCVTYSGAGDKSRDIAEPHQPTVVLECQREVVPDKIAEYIESIEQQNLGEYVLLPYFDVSNAVYVWPARDDIIKRTKNIANEVNKYLGGKYTIYNTEHYMIIDLNDK